MTSFQTGLILFAHGARHAEWALPFERVAQRIRAQRPQLHVRLAYLEIMAPSLAEAGADLAGCGCLRVDVLPLFLGLGGHLRRDLPQLVAALRLAHPGLAVSLHPPVGEWDEVIAAMAAAACTVLEGQGP
jgi:sirohydrochlorin cobaltochelatase